MDARVALLSRGIVLRGHRVLMYRSCPVTSCSEGTECSCTAPDPWHRAQRAQSAHVPLLTRGIVLRGHRVLMYRSCPVATCSEGMELLKVPEDLVDHGESTQPPWTLV
eukprot:TRINITY_DN110990_c0_g2_i2.p1 TRINITY_DN110990_c0_g2~~TRINITY_DN110990_c0_g2_i2.p1  ORF type:complete len:118 (+),score=11.88 TRINITY_DN110990_c0_g2_i2:31-354(+)